MKYGINIAWLICFLLVTDGLMAQAQERVIRGTIKDQQTLEPVPAVHVVTSQRGTFSSSDGFFSIETIATDTILLSHINYQPYYLATRPVNDTLVLFLRPRDLMLREIIVRGLPTEEQFKEQLLGINLSLSREEVHAITNFANAHKLFLSGYVPAMNSRDNYQWQLQEPQGVTLFSSGPTKGLAKAMKNLFRDKDLPTPLPMHPAQTVPEFTFTGASDSLRGKLSY